MSENPKTPLAYARGPFNPVSPGAFCAPNPAMKILKIALLASLALAPCLASRAVTPAQNWLETYYQNPRPDALPRMVQELSYQGYFDQAGHSAVAIGFLSTVFQQNPERVDGWVAALGHLPLAHQRLVATPPFGRRATRWEPR